MAGPVSVDVNPSSSTQASSGASSGYAGGITFAFGGNPNLALLNAGGSIAGVPAWMWAAGAAVIVLGVLLWRRR